MENRSPTGAVFSLCLAAFWERKMSFKSGNAAKISPKITLKSRHSDNLTHYLCWRKN